MATVIFVIFQITCFIGTFAVCYAGQLLVDEVYLFFYYYYLWIKINQILFNYQDIYQKFYVQQSENVRQACSTLNWYRLPVKKARSLILLILMSNYPIKVTAGRIVDVSLVTFTSVSMKTLDLCYYYFFLHTFCYLLFLDH